MTVDHRGFAPGVDEVIFISVTEAPQAWADYKIRVRINGRYYVGELELSE